MLPITTAPATRSSQPISAVLRCRALQPAIRSTAGARLRRGGPVAVSSACRSTDGLSMRGLTGFVAVGIWTWVMRPSRRGCVAGSDVPPQDVGGEVGVLVAGGDVKGEAEGPGAGRARG